MKKRISMLIVSVITIVSEIIPYGAVCVFTEDGVQKTKRTFSYFDLTPFGYANFAPFITAISSCIVCILCILSFWIHNKAIEKTISVIAILSIMTSILPVLFGIDYITITGVCVTLSMVIIFVFSILKWQENE